ncbi:metalloprotease [Rhizobium sp.]
MISMKMLLHVALLVLGMICLQMLRRIGSGREIVRVSRRSTLDVDAAWDNLFDAWQATGLTFRQADIIDNDDGTRRVRHGAEDELLIEPISAPTERAIVFRVLTINGRDYLPGAAHFEHWRIEPDGAGARIIVETRFRSTISGSIGMLWGLWKQAGIVASPQTHAALTGQAPAAVSKSDPAARRPAPRRPQTASPAGYGREAAMSLLAFAYLLTQFSWQSAVVLAAVILWHEYGHLLAYQLTGRTGNRMMLVPFFGGMAVAGAPHRNEFERTFCALMGPGICAPVSLGAYALWYYDVMPEYSLWLWSTFYFSAMLNLLNLLPIYPLDGGQAAESFLRSFLPGSIMVHLSGLAVVGILLLAGMKYYEMAVFVGFFAFVSFRALPQHSHLPAMSFAQAAAMTIFYALIAGSHGAVFYFIAF